MTESMNQLIPIFEDIIKANNFITFAYSSLDDRWFYLSMKAGDDYDSTKILGNLNQAYAYMLEECQYYWLKRNRLLQTRPYRRCYHCFTLSGNSWSSGRIPGAICKSS
ncbi:MAG: hypothetical protein ACLTBV_04170 [Enterocloster bolteae]